jgi:DNA-binding MarR family transcriptional regulator
MSTQSNDPEFARAAALAADLRAVMGKLKRRLREQARLGDLTESQISTLSRLEREGSATVTALAQAEGMRPQSMGAIVAALEAAGLVTRALDPNDGRQTLLSLTDACRERIKAARAAREDWLLRAIQKNIAPAEHEQLEGAVKLLKRLVET